MYHRLVCHAQISWRKLLWMALKPWNSWLFSPSTVFCYTVSSPEIFLMSIFYTHILGCYNVPHYHLQLYFRNIWNVFEFLVEFFAVVELIIVNALTDHKFNTDTLSVSFIILHVRMLYSLKFSRGTCVSIVYEFAKVCSSTIVSRIIFPGVAARNTVHPVMYMYLKYSI